MSAFRKKIYIAAGYNTTFIGPGRPEFNPGRPQREFESYLQETTEGTLSQLPQQEIDEGVIGNFMSARFLHQGHLSGFLPFMIPSLQGKPCTAVEGACGSGGRAIASGIRSVLADLSEVVFVAGFEIQNTVKSVYGADILGGAAYYKKERKNGEAFFFPGVFAARAGAYYAKYGEEDARKGMAKWYEQAICNARKNPKAQEFYNRKDNLFDLGMTSPQPERFLPHINAYDCSKVSDGAASLIIASEEGLQRCKIDKQSAIEVVGMGLAQGDITQDPKNLTWLDTTAMAVKKALQMAQISQEAIGVLELHDCFTITALLAIETLGYCAEGKAASFILDGHTGPEGKIPINPSGGLIGFGHPTGASGVRQMVDLQQQLTKKAPHPVQMRSPYGMMISMGGNDKTVTCLIVKSA